jgi:hypothetical protein
MHLNIQYFFLINFCLNVDEFARPYGNFSHDHATSSNGRFQRQVSTIMTRKKNQLHTPQHNWGFGFDCTHSFPMVISNGLVTIWDHIMPLVKY